MTDQSENTIKIQLGGNELYRGYLLQKNDAKTSASPKALPINVRQPRELGDLEGTPTPAGIFIS